MIPTETSEDLEAVHSRHRDVEEDEVRRLAPNTLERLFAVDGLGHGVPSSSRWSVVRRAARRRWRARAAPNSKTARLGRRVTVQRGVSLGCGR